MSRISLSPEGENKYSFIGNGRLGASVAGQTDHEVISLYEESVWSGPWTDRNNPDSKKALKNIRTLLEQNRTSEAQEIIYETMTGIPTHQAEYEKAGELHIDFFDGEHFGLETTDGKRPGPYDGYYSITHELDTDTGTDILSFATESGLPSTSDFSRGASGSSITFTRETFVSATSDVIVCHISSSSPKTICFRANLEKPGCAKKYSLSNDTIVMLDTKGIPYATMVTAVASGGTVSVRGENLIVERADDVTLYIDVETEFRRRHYFMKCGDVHKKPLSAAMVCADAALKKICFAAGTSPENLKSAHNSEFSAGFTPAVLETDNESIKKRWETAVYGIYSSTKNPGTLPSPDCGLWLQNKDSRRNFSLSPEAWDLAEIMCGFTENCTARFNLLKSLFRHGKSTAEKMYGVLGFAAHNSTDIWGDSCPEGHDLARSYSALGAAAAACSVMEYYDYTLDEKFLKKNFKYLQKACTFFENCMVTRDKDNHYALSPAFCDKSEGQQSFVLPENPKDTTLIRRLFEATVRAMTILGYKENRASFMKCTSMISDLKAEPFHDRIVSPDTESDDFTFAASVINSIALSRIDRNRVELEILPNLPESMQNGSIKGLVLKGNLLADISWKNGAFDGAKVYARNEQKHIANLAVTYREKRYIAKLTDGTLDLRNVLPTTV